MTHICVSKLTIIGSDNGLSPGRRQAIIWTNDAILLIRTFRTHLSEIVSEIHTFSFNKMHFKMSSGQWRPSCLGLNVLNRYCNFQHGFCLAYSKTHQPIRFDVRNLWFNSNNFNKEVDWKHQFRIIPILETTPTTTVKEFPLYRRILSFNLDSSIILLLS